MLSAILQIAISFGEILASSLSQGVKTSVIAVEIAVLAMLVVFSVRERKQCSQKGRGIMLIKKKHVLPSTKNQVGAAAAKRLFRFN